MPTPYPKVEGNTLQGAKREPWSDSARSMTLSMSGSYGEAARPEMTRRGYLHRIWEVSSVPEGTNSGGAGKGNRNPAINAGEKSDVPIVPKKLLNKGQAEFVFEADPAETMEGRGTAKGNAEESPAGRTLSRGTAVTGLQRVRETAKKHRRLKFTALLHHITPSLLDQIFYDLNKTAAVGVDKVTWQEYEKILSRRIHELHREIHSGAYRAQASRRIYIHKADGKLRPLGIAAVEDKIVQQAVVKVLSAIYEGDFLGFSYGFRQGRGSNNQKGPGTHFPAKANVNDLPMRYSVQNCSQCRANV